MEFRSRFMPVLLSGTLALGTMGAPLSAFAQTVDQYDTDKAKAAYVANDLKKRVDNDEISQAKADAILAKFKAVVAAENEAAEQKLAEELAQAEQAAPDAAGEEAEGSQGEAAEGEGAGEGQGEAAEGEGAGEGQGDGQETDGGEDGGQGADAPAGPSDDPDGEGTDDPEPSDKPGSPEGDSEGESAEDPADSPAKEQEAADGQDSKGSKDSKADAEKDDAAKDSKDSKDSKGSKGSKGSKEDAKSGKHAKDGNSAKSGKHAKSDKDKEDASGAEADGDADKAADKKAAKAKHAKKTAEQEAREAAEKQQAAAREFATQAKEAAQKDAAEAVANSDTYASAYTGENQGYTRIKYTANLSTEMFIASIGEQARQIGQDKSLYASVMIAQAVIESDSGNSGLSRAPYNNLFGIKGAHEGNSVTMSTQEDNGSGSLYTIDAAFRAYDTQAESLEDYADLLRGDMGHYYKAWKENADTYEDAAKALQGTYATSTVYADTICAVIEAYDLTRYDEPLSFEITGENADGEPLTMNDYAQLEANAVSFLGTPYVWGGTTPKGFDCSGFVQYLYQQTFGIALPRTTYTMQHEGEEVAFKDLQMGDLLFFVDGGSTEHVAMYLGNGFYIHAPEPGDSIKIADMESYTPTFAKRILQTKAVDGAEAADDAGKADAKTAKPKAGKSGKESKKAADAESDATAEDTADAADEAPAKA